MQDLVLVHQLTNKGAIPLEKLTKSQKTNLDLLVRCLEQLKHNLPNGEKSPKIQIQANQECTTQHGSPSYKCIAVSIESSVGMDRSPVEKNIPKVGRTCKKAPEMLRKPPPSSLHTPIFFRKNSCPPGKRKSSSQLPLKGLCFKGITLEPLE